MEPTITVQNLELTPRLENYVEKKTSRLDRYMPNLTAIQVELSQENTRSAQERQIAEITIRDDRGTILRAEERNSDMFAAIDQVTDKLYRQIERYRGKRKARYRGSKPEELNLGEPLPIEEEMIDESPHIVRRKRFPLHPMSPDEAVEQMELLGHDFYIFFNSDDEAINLIYRRHDDNYGLLQPEMD
ncbi:MAG: ribosome-associated translation inhibitor RaiA [Chloroflexota bacterium]